MGRPEVLLPVVTNLGTDFRVYKMARSLYNLGFQPVVLCDRPKTSPGAEWENIRIKVLTKSSHMDGFFRTWLKFILRLGPILISSSSKIWIIEDCPALFLAALLGKMKRAEVIYDSHEIYLESPDLNRSPLRKLFWTGWHHGGIALIKKMIVVSPDSEKYFKAKFPRLEFSMLPNVPFLSSRQPGPAATAPSEETILIYQGYLRSENDLRPVLRAMAGLKGYSFIIVGEGGEKSNLQNIIGELGLESRVHMTGMVPFYEVPNWTRKAHIGIHITRPDSLNLEKTWQNKMFDYVHAGLPALMGKTEGMQAFMKAHRVGILVDPDNVDEIRHGLEELRQNYADYQRECESARQQWNWENNEKILARILGVR